MMPMPIQAPSGAQTDDQAGGEGNKADDFHDDS
jgi:hypothetical protein